MISLINFEGNYDKKCSNLTKHLDTSRLENRDAARAAIFLSFAHNILFVRLMNQSVTKTGSGRHFFKDEYLGSGFPFERYKLNNDESLGNRIFSLRKYKG